VAQQLRRARAVRLSRCFIADDIETAAKVSALIRTFGHAQTEIWTATEWDRFKEIVRTLPGPT
jgi:hypothetical protein